MTNIYIPVFLKRINKELENFNDKKYISIASNEIKNLFDKINIDIISVPKINTMEKSYYLKVFKNDKFYLELSIPSCYPFKPYDVASFRLQKSIIPYSRYMNNAYERIKFKDKEILIFFFKNQYQIEPNFLYLDKECCYCCSSIVCPNNWSPGCRIDNVLIEYLELEFIHKYSTKLGYKYLTNIYEELLKNTYFSQLPDELIEIILNKNKL